MYAISGACIAGVPLALMLMIQSFSNAALNRQIDRYRELEESELYLTVWMLKKDITAGEKVKRAYLEKKKTWITEKDSIRIADISQITGKKAKKALKKGTIMMTEMLYLNNKEKHKD